MCEGDAVESRANERGGIFAIGSDRGREGEAAAPVGGCFGVNTTEEHPAVAGGAFDHSGSSVRIRCDDGTPAGKLRAIFPIDIQRPAAWDRNGDGCLADAARFGGIETEADSAGEVQSVVGAVAGEEGSSTNSEIVHAAVHGAANVVGGGSGESAANVQEVSAGDDQEPVAPELRFI